MSKTALIVEDEAAQNEILSEFVIRRGFEPVPAYTGQEGLTKAKAQPPDLLLLDLLLPDADGFEICEELRSHRETNLIPIVMATALTGTQHRVHGFRVGANCYVGKPYTRAQIFQAIDDALAWKTQMIEGQVEREFAFDLASDTQFLVQVNDLICQLLLVTPLGEEAVHQFRLALLEMGQNAIEWGNRNQVEKAVKITYRLHPDRVTVNIRDQGAGFNPQQLPHAASGDDPTAHLAIREVLGLREGGFGILISRGAADELQYNEIGNEVTLTKRFPPRRR